MQESHQVARIGQPDQCMDVVGHQHKSNAPGLQCLQLVIQHAQDHSLGLIEIEQSPPPVDGEGDIMDVPLIVKSASSVAHATIVLMGSEHFKRLTGQRFERDWDLGCLL
jgi:hypothetical protein